MKRSMLALAAMLALCTHSEAQLKNLMKQVKNGVEQKIANKTVGTVGDVIDGKTGKKQGETPPAETVAKTSTMAEPAAAPALEAVTKFDFVPGEKILYAHDFQGEAMGELPAGWNTNGKAELVTLKQYPGNWMSMQQENTYITSNTGAFGDNYTVEFDIILNMQNNGYTFPNFNFGIMAANPMNPTGNDVLRNLRQYFSADISMRLMSGGATNVTTSTHVQNKAYYTGSEQNNAHIEKFYGKPMHVAMQAQKERLRVWIGGVKVVDAPKALPADANANQLYFKVGGSSYLPGQLGFYISNIKVATGIPDTRHELAEKGRFTTRGILFEFQQAVLRPESYPVIKEICAVLKEHADMKLQVIGHTSNDGDAAANLELSRQRARAVKDYMVENFGIDASCLTTDGKGGSEPADKGTTPEAKANNRRVEFVKL